MKHKKTRFSVIRDRAAFPAPENHFSDKAFWLSAQKPITVAAQLPSLTEFPLSDN
jgi:hypothetical protein